MDHNCFYISKNNHVSFFHDGPDYHNEYLNLIRNSKRIIHLQTYIFMMDEFGKNVYNELINASKRGVKVYLLVDSVGSRLFTQKAENELIKAGVFFSRFNKVNFKSLHSWGRRLHHKILLVDNEKSFVGGINVMSSDENKFAFPQLDFALLLMGPIISRLTRYCQKIFKKASLQKIIFPKIVFPGPMPDGVDLKILVNDWVYKRWQITRQYVHLTKNAKHDITIINSYFFPRKSFMKQLVEAAKRGVRVRLILPKYSDWPSYILASEFLYAYFLKNGIEIYLWKKSILHGKMALIDGEWATIGSFNLNYTSYQQNLEMNINIYSEDFTNKLKEEVEEIIQTGCEKLDSNDFINKCSFKNKILRLFYYIILSLIATFSVGVTHQYKNKK